MMLANKMQKKKPATVKIAMWSARHRWTVFGVWFLVTIGLLVGGQLLGNKTYDPTGVQSNQSESTKALALFKEAGYEQRDTLYLVVNHPTIKVSDPAFKATVEDITARLSAVTYNENGQQKPVFLGVINYYNSQNPALVSADGTAMRLIATISGKFEDAKDKTKDISKATDAIKAKYADYTIVGFSNASTNEQFLEIFSHSFESSVKYTLPLTFAILLIAFGALVAAFVPLILGITALLATFGLIAIYSQLVNPLNMATSHIVVMIGLAVAVDYSLFMITRYRAERRKGREKMAAIEVASSTAGRAVFFSGITVMISLAGLFLINDDTFTSIAVGTIAVVLVSIIGSLTFLPATLAILGKGINWGRIPYFGRERAEDSGVWSRIVRGVMSKPIFLAGIVVIMLVGLATPLLHMRLGDSSASVENLPKAIEYRQATLLMQEKWPQGSVLYVDVVVKSDNLNNPELKAAMDKFSAEALKLKGLTGPVETIPSPSGKAVMLRFIMGGDYNSQENRDLVTKVRKELAPATLKPVSGTEVYVTGWAALILDVVDQYTAALPWVFGFVLGLSFLLLLVAFHSIVIPIKAIALNLLSTGAAYGATVLVFQDGFLSEFIGFTKVPVIEPWLPLFLFTILFGLSMDYHLFVLTRIKEEKDKGATSNEAVAKGISITSGTITSAASIMVVVFGIFITMELMMLRQLGLGLAVAVFIDATIIRSILLPASMKLLGDWNWYMPKFLSWVPRVTIEAEEAEVTEVKAEERELATV